MYNCQCIALVHCSGRKEINWVFDKRGFSPCKCKFMKKWTKWPNTRKWLWAFIPIFISAWQWSTRNNEFCRMRYITNILALVQAECGISTVTGWSVAFNIRNTTVFPDMGMKIFHKVFASKRMHLNTSIRVVVEFRWTNRYHWALNDS